MLTEKKIKAWWRLGPDGRSGQPFWRRQVLTSEEAGAIGLLISHCHIIQHVTTTQSFIDDYERRMATLVEDDAARNLIREYAERYWS